MSILQEYEQIKKEVGEEKWNSIDIYINNHHPELLLDQIIYNRDNWLKFEEWYYKNIKVDNVNVLEVWETDYDDYRADVEIGKGEILYGKIIASYDADTIRGLTNNLNKPLSEDELKNAFAVLVASSFEYFINLPKISEVSPLLKEIYDNVCKSDSTSCHITPEEWDDYYSKQYSQKDIEILEEEIKKYGLDSIIDINEDKYKIIGYGDLETCFINDSYLIHSIDNGVEL